MPSTTQVHPSSFRDPAGYIYFQEGRLFRQINPNYLDDYHCLKQSGLYSKLVERQLLIPHKEVEQLSSEQSGLTIQPELIDFISFPYEWSFSQLKDAALLTLEIQKEALECGMSLKDASCYNVQFRKGKAIFIDTLSFEKYQNQSPWQAYKQFCQHFLAPLYLMAYKDIRLNQLLKLYIDGIPLDLASQLLPLKTRLKLSTALHIHMHAKLQKKFQHTQVAIKTHQMPLRSLKQLILGLIQTVKKIQWKIEKRSEWFDYYQSNHNYSTQATTAKEQIIADWLSKISPNKVWDIGANTGKYSLIATQFAKSVVAWDIDASCIESFYLHCRNKNYNLLPLILDLNNPSPSIGWENQERASFIQRGPSDLVLALGLIHHLAIVNNLPLTKISKFFSDISRYLIIEFVPKTDSQVQKLLATRKDIFSHYCIDAFEAIFKENFEILSKNSVEDSQRTLYLLKNRNPL